MNNIQQFLEEEKREFAEKVTSIALTDYLIKSETRMDEAIKDHDTRIINFILSEVEGEVENVIEQEATWYNTNNHIPNTETVKGDEHWEMIQKAVKDSLKEASGRMIKDISTIINQLKLK